MIRVEDVVKTYHRGKTRALSGVSFEVVAGKTLGVIGESGSGKSTLARAILCLEPCDRGEVFWGGQRVDRLRERQRLPLRRQVQIIFQDPFLSFDPKMTILQSLAEPFFIHGHKNKDEIRKKITLFADLVHLKESHLERYPSRLSGGECQRASIARALVLGPKALVCDEAVSSLDPILRTEIVGLLKDIQKKTQMAMVFITHDLSIARRVSDDILVLKDGQVCEYGTRESIYGNPRHPYTKELLG